MPGAWYMPGEFKGSSMGLERTSRDVSERSRTEARRLIRKRRVTSRSATSPAKVDVAGSTPVSRSKTSLRALRLDFALRTHQLRRFAPAARASSPLGDFACRDRGSEPSPFALSAPAGSISPRRGANRGRHARELGRR